VALAGPPRARTCLDLLQLPYPFSQVGLLNASEFAELATLRRSRTDRSLPPVNEQTLQELHRSGVFVPLFRVDLTPRLDAPGIDISDSATARHVLTTHINELLRGAAEGRVSDPATVGFEPWPTERHRSQWPTGETGYLYSQHQLLGLDAVRSFVARLKPRVDDRNATWLLEDASWPNAPTLQAMGSWRKQAITLSALDTYYWPQITHQLSHDFDAWRKALHAFDRKQTLAWPADRRYQCKLLLDSLTKNVPTQKLPFCTVLVRVGA
jgi:hypothetical protein